MRLEESARSSWWRARTLARGLSGGGALVRVRHDTGQPYPTFSLAAVEAILVRDGVRAASEGPIQTGIGIISLVSF